MPRVVSFLETSMSIDLVGAMFIGGVGGGRSVVVLSGVLVRRSKRAVGVRSFAVTVRPVMGRVGEALRTPRYAVKVSPT